MSMMIIDAKKKSRALLKAELIQWNVVAVLTTIFAAIVKPATTRWYRKR